MQATFFQNVGLVVVRFTSTVAGRMCKRCIDASFLRTSAISFFFGWWGVISFFFTLVTLPVNVVTWLRSLSLPPPPPDDLALAPTEQALAAPAPFGAPTPPAFGAPTAPALGAPPAASAFGAPAARPPSSGGGADGLAIVALLLGVLALLVTAGVTLVGVGMIVAPIQADDPKSGAMCILLTSLACGLPGLLGVGAGAVRLARRRRT